MKKIYFLLLLLFIALPISGQEFIIKGTVIDSKTAAPVEVASVRLMKADSTFIGGESTSSKGFFSFNVKASGKYLLKISFIGYKSRICTAILTSRKKIEDLGVIKLANNDVALQQATVTARAAQVELKGDTFVYNVSAYRVPEGSTLEALVKKLPGAEVDDAGAIKINGKSVSQIRVDGKDFFKGDTKIAMKNLPVELIDKVKAYDKQSDYSKQTGIDDGEDETVLDLNLKNKLKSTWFSNMDLGLGNKDRYSSKVFFNRFTDNTRVTAFGSMNNVNDKGFDGGGPGFRGGGGSGLVASKSAGIDGFWNNGVKEDSAHFFQLGGNIRLNHNNSDALSRTNSEAFLTSSAISSYANSSSHTLSENSGVNLGLNLEWEPDSVTWFYFRPEYSHSSSSSRGDSRSVTFNANPYDIEGMDNPLDSIFFADNPLSSPISLVNIAINRNSRKSLSDSKADNFSNEFNITRRLNNKGRSISLRGETGYSHSTNNSFSLSDIYYYKTTKSTYSNQYSTSPAKSWNYSARVSYSEPIFIKNLFFQGSYEYEYKYSNGDKNLYQLDSLRDWGIGTLHPFGTLPDGDSLNIAKNVENSQYATYKNYIHTVNLGFRYVTKTLNFHAGIRLQPQRTKLDYQRNLLDTVVIRNVFNIAPDLRLRWGFSQLTRLEFRYRGSSSQPTMTDLLDVTDNSDPLNITKGNSGLKPSWSNNFNLFFNTYSTEHQQSIFTNLAFTQTSNSISSAVTYNEITGVRVTRPENINGNWNTNGFFGFNRSFGSENVINLNTGTSLSYANSVGYMSISNASSEKNIVKTLNLGERLRTSFRTDNVEIGVNGSINYSKSCSRLQSQSNLETYTFAYGGNLQYNSDWNMSVSTDISMNSRRGFSDNSMNTNELIWNAQLSQTFFSNKATLSIQFYDLLHQQSNISRIVNAQMRMDTWSNAINSYFMVHFIYRLNIFGGQNGRIKFGERDHDHNRFGGEGRHGGGNYSGGRNFGGTGHM